jgi:hypothetical protein
MDADKAAVGAVVARSLGLKGMLTDLPTQVLPRLRTGLRLRRCGGGKESKTEETIGNEDSNNSEEEINTVEERKVISGKPGENQSGSFTIDLSDKIDENDTVTGVYYQLVNSGGDVIDSGCEDNLSRVDFSPVENEEQKYEYSWSGKQSVGIEQPVFIDGDYHIEIWVALNYKEILCDVEKMEDPTNLMGKGTDTDTISTKSDIITVDFSKHIKSLEKNGETPHLLDHNKEDNIEELARILYAEARGEGEAEQKAVAWAVRNQMLRLGTDKVAETDVIKRASSKPTEPSGPATEEDKQKYQNDLKIFEEMKVIAKEVLSEPIANDPTSGAFKWFSPKSQDTCNSNPSQSGCEGGKKTVKDANGEEHEAYFPGWASDMQEVDVDGVDEWAFKFYAM